MKWTYDWLMDYLNTDASAATIADTLTRVGLEVDDVITTVSPVAAKIVECTPHENSDHLHVLKVDDGTGTLRQVVCGAPNARVGLVSALALPGCKIGGVEIKSGKLRGVLSDGMMCSARELGIGDDHSGIIELAPDIAAGTKLGNAATVFDAGITPNRPDYLAVRGIARDLAAAGVGEYIAPNDELLADVAGTRHVDVQTDKCPVYRFCEIHNINICNSDDVVARRLAAIGINPKNAPIDATNYICYDMGQPMHCFDADDVHGDIVVRMAAANESFTDLFGTTHELTPNDIVIADDMGILALAGVVGGARGMTGDKTRNIILESAYFDPVSVRKTSKRIGMSTDASYRYERGIDPTISGPALARAAKIIMTQCGGEIVGTGIGGAGAAAAPVIEYTPDMFAAKTGIEMDADDQMKILKSLGYETVVDGNTWRITPPAARVDAEIAENIVSELIRMYGYDKIAAAATRAPAIAADVDNTEFDIKRTMAARGLNERVSFGFGNAPIEQMLNDRACVMIANPITADMDTLRNSLLPNMLMAVAENENRGYPNLAMFEFGTVFDGDAPGDQHDQICIVRTGATGPRHWTGTARDVNIYDVKADIRALMQGQAFTIDTQNPPKWAHPFRYGAGYQGKKKIAEFGELHPSIARRLKIKTPVVIAIVDDVNNLPRGRKRKNPHFADFQPISRDFAFITDADYPAANLVAAAVAADNRISDAVVFDAFDMGDGKKSIAFTITILPTENMTDADLMGLQNAVIENVAKKCGAQIRDR